MEGAPGRARARGRARLAVGAVGAMLPNAVLSQLTGGGAESAEGSELSSRMANVDVREQMQRSDIIPSRASSTYDVDEDARSEVSEVSTSAYSRTSATSSEVTEGSTASFGSNPSSCQPGTICSDKSSGGNRQQVAGITRTIKDDFNKFGSKGNPHRVVTNYYGMNKSPDFQLLQYRVDFIPVEDNTNLKKSLLRQREDVLGKYVFDGSILYKTADIPPEHQSLKVTNQMGGTTFTIMIRLVGKVNPEDPMFLQFYNIVMRKCMTLLGMEELGRNLYDRNAAIKFPSDRLQLWPGFVTAIRNHEEGTLLCVEVTHKVLRAETVLDVMKALKRPNQQETEWEKLVRAEVEDTIVMTFYNSRTYKISNIDFTCSPRSTFRGQDGTTQTYAEYFARRYNLVIPEAQMDQPMLVSSPKKRDINKGVTGDIYLVPSLCNPTGLSDTMRKNFELMKKLSAHLHMDPTTRKQKLDEFMKKLKTDPRVVEEFKAWNVDFSAEAVMTEARVLALQKIVVGPEERGPIDSDMKGDWTKGMKNRQVLKPEHLKRWLVFCPPANASDIRSFITTLKKMGGELGVRVDDPIEIINYDSNRCDKATLNQHVQRHGRNLDLLFFVLPNNNLRRYSEIKHYCTLVLGVPSQCYLARNLNHRQLASVASKVMIQVTAKLGGVPWSINIPSQQFMVLGFDVYHCSNRKGESAGALVGTTSKSLTSYCSLVSFHKDKSELAANLCNDFVEILKEYRKVNNTLPSRIIMFRDGVGEGQINYVLDHEVQQMQQGITDIYAGDGQDRPTLTFVIVTKKINTRAFLDGKRNLPVGTVMDRDITLPERYDFFMVSQDVRQGTVSPTNYNVVFDTSTMQADQMQLLTYKMCHLYFNWSGTVAVPAPCQYAHKLAYLTGVAVGEKPQPVLNTKLWYL